jgi:hypothetical protein
MQRELLGATAVEMAPTLRYLGRLADQKGSTAAAEKLYEESIALYRKHNMDRRPEAASVMNDLAGLYLQRSDYSRAECPEVDAINARADERREHCVEVINARGEK